MCAQIWAPAEGFYNILYSATYESFDDNVDSIKRTTGTGIAALITWYLVIKKKSLEHRQLIGLLCS